MRGSSTYTFKVYLFCSTLICCRKIVRCGKCCGARFTSDEFKVSLGGGVKVPLRIAERKLLILMRQISRHSRTGSRTPNADSAPLTYFLGMPVRLQLRSELHLLRKMWHVSMGSLIAFLYLGGMGRWVAVGLLLIVFVIDVALETLRLHIPAFNEACLRFWGPLMRANEIHRMSGVPPYLASAAIAITAFPKPVAVLSILYLACGDPMASFFGVLYGKDGYRFPSGKSVIGTLAGVCTCMVLTAYFLVTQGLGHQLGVAGVIALSSFGGLVGGTVELLPLDLDDNFTIPVVSGFLLWAAFMAFGI